MNSLRTARILFCIGMSISLSSVFAYAQTPITITADLTDYQKGIIHSHLTIPVKPGPLTLGYPKWIPGEHAPTGALNQIIKLKFSSKGNALPWRRDDVEIYDFKLNIPAGVTDLDIDLDFASVDITDGFSATATTSEHIAIVNWWQLVLFPADASADRLILLSRLLLPSGWLFGTALPIQYENTGQIDFAPASLRTLVDSPVVAAEHFREIQLGGHTAVELDLAGESERSISISSEQVNHFTRLVEEAESLFGGAPYSNYHLLLTLSDPLAHYTLEHASSSDNRFVEDALSSPDKFLTTASTIPHEFVHAWNGKARVPSGFDTLNYQQPQKADLVWVYEGLTEYLGMVLTTRSGFWSPKDFREALALDAAEMATHPGRQWRSLEDTAVAVQLLTTAPAAWQTERRSTDFYAEGALIWLEADTTIRRLSDNKHTLDDFCKLFFAAVLNGHSKTYALEDVISDLNAVQPYDWKTFFAQRLQSTSPAPPTGGIIQAGWRLSYKAQETNIVRSLERAHKTDLLWPLWGSQATVDERFSIGILLNEDGTVLDVSRDMAAFQAGVIPGVKIIQVNHRLFSASGLHKAVSQTSNGGTLQLVFDHDAVRHTAEVNYNGGSKSPDLVRVTGTDDLLTQIIAPNALK